MSAYAVIYTRFSPRRNAEESVSCDTQEEQCRQAAKIHGWIVRAAYRDEAVSGKVLYRPGLEDALKALRKGDFLLVYRRDRIARDTLVAELTRRRVHAAGAQIVACEGDVSGDDANPTVRFIRQVMDAVAELERKQIAARTKASMLSLQARGRRMSRYAPYGFDLHGNELVPNPREQEAVEKIRELHGSGMNINAIAQNMNSEMLDYARGAMWSYKTVRKVISRQ